MTVEVGTASKRGRWKYLLIPAGLLIALVGFGLWYLTTDSFQLLVRRRLIAEIEQITGGKAEVGSFHTIPFRMQVDVRNITVHGSEGPKDVPLAHADRLVAELKVISFARTELGFHELMLDHAVIHIAFDPNGRSNIPGPALHRAAEADIENLFGLSIDHFDVRRGELIWNDQRIPLDFGIRDTNLQMNYSHLHSFYDGHLLLGKVDSKIEDFRPFSWMTDLQFTLSTSAAEIKSLQLASGKSRIQVNGHIDNFRNPHLQVSYEGTLDLGEMSAIARRNSIRSGMLQIRGSGLWSPDHFGTSGFASLLDFGWQDKRFLLRTASGSADYSITDQEFKLTNFQGRILDGSFAGEAEVENWRNLTRAPNNGLKEERAIITAGRRQAGAEPLQYGTVHLRVHDVSAGELTSALNAGGNRLGRFHPAGFATGSLDARWRGIPNDAETNFAFDVNSPARSAAGNLPVVAHVQGTYRGTNDQLELKKFSASTPNSRVEGVGVLSTSSALRLSVVTSNLDELRPIIALLHGPADVPFTIHGSASFNGVATGSPFSPGFSGTLVAHDFDFTVPATSRLPEQPVHWDSLFANLQYSPQNLTLRHGHLHRGDTSAEFEVSSNLENGEFKTEDSFTARINLRKVDVASTEALARFDYPLTGTANISLEMNGTRANPHVQGEIHAVNASAYGESIRQFDGNLDITNGRIALLNIRLAHENASVTGDASLTPATRAFDLDLVGTNFDLAHVRQIPKSRLNLTGRADFVLKASGTPTAPAINGNVQLRNLTLNGDSIGALQLSAVSKDADLHVAAQSNFNSGSLTLDGLVTMRKNYPADVSMRIHQFTPDFFWAAYARGELTGPSAVSGTITMHGPLGDPQLWAVIGDMEDVSLELQHVKLHNREPIRFTYAEQKLQIQQLRLIGDNSDFSAQGSMSFEGARNLNLTGEGKTNLALLHAVDPEFTASGDLTMNMTVTGTISDPLPEGRVEVFNGAVAYTGVPSGLTEMNGSLTFNQNRVHIEKLTARTGGGTLDFHGDATSYTQQLSFNLTAMAKDVRLRYPPGVSSTANAQLHWVGTRSASTVSGDILVNKLAVTPNFDFGSYLNQTRQGGTVTPINSPLNNIKLDIHVVTAPELQMRTASARLSGDADLHLRGSIAHPAVLGRADILEGEATFNGTRFHLERGDITFTNPVTIEPQVNLQASAHVRSYDLDVTVTGTPERLSVNYRSEPPLAKADIVAMLALGRSEEASHLQEQQQYTQTPFTDEATTAAILNQAINSTESNRMQKLFGVSRIRIDPQGLTTQTSPTSRGPQVTIEQQFANNVSLTYSTNVSQTGDQIIQGEYFFTRNTSVVGTRDWNGVVSFDIRLRRHKK